MKRSSFSLILILGALCTISPFSIDMYLPAFPEMAQDLRTTVSKIALSVSSYFIGLAVAQVFYGPALDRFGRKPPLYFGLTLYILASLGCIVSKSVEALIVFRCLQALGGCAAQVAALAMVRDFFPAKEAAKVFSLLVLMIGLSPLLAPSVGSFVTIAFGWQAVFYILSAIVVFILFIVYFFLPEGHTPDPSISLHPKPIMRGFSEILAVPQFYTYAIAGALSFSGLFVYVAGSPALFMGAHQLSAKVYGAIFAGLSVGFIGSSQVNILLMKKFRSAQIFRVASFLQVTVALLFLIGSIFDWYGLASTVVLLFLFISCLGICSPNGSALAMMPFSKNAGSAAALLGFLQMGIGALMSSGVGILDAKQNWQLATLFTATAIGGYAMLRWGSRNIVELVEGGSENLISLH